MAKPHHHKQWQHSLNDDSRNKCTVQVHIQSAYSHCQDTLYYVYLLVGDFLLQNYKVITCNQIIFLLYKPHVLQIISIKYN